MVSKKVVLHKVKNCDVWGKKKKRPEESWGGSPDISRQTCWTLHDCISAVEIANGSCMTAILQ